MTALDVDTLREWLTDGRPVTVLDVRDPEDYREWAIPGSRNADIYDDLKRDAAKAVADVDVPAGRPVVAVCYAGFTSALAAEALRAKGHEAYTLAGGMRAWSLAWNVADVPVPGSRARVVQVRRTGKGCLSYVVGDGGEAAVIDPSLPPEVYEGIAKRHGWRIAHVLDTHVHADHLSRAKALSERVGARLHLPETDRAKFPHDALADGAELKIGASRLRTLATPGHTIESVCYHLDGKALFTGDTLFLGSIGRPDLEASPEGARERAHALHRSLHALLRLDRATLVLPAHASEPVPFDGKPLVATLHEASGRVPLLLMSERRFVDEILQRLPATPPNHHRIVVLNEEGRWPTDDVTELEAGANRCAVM